MKRKLCFLSTLCLGIFLFTACSSSDSPGSSEVSGNDAETMEISENTTADYGIPENAAEIVSQNSTVSPAPEAEPIEYTISDNMVARFTSYDLVAEYDESAAILLSFEGDTLSVTGEGVTVENNRIIISKAGTYLLEGTLNDGQIYINAGDDDKVQLVLNGVSLSCSNGPVIYSANADKTILTIAENTENYCTDGTVYDSSDANGCIYSKQDLTINGSGTLTVTGNFGNGISTKDDLRIYNATLFVTAANNGLKGNDSISVLDALITIVSNDDGMKSDNEEDPSKGFIFIANSYLDITADDDCFQAFQAFVFDENSVAYVRCYGKDVNCDSLILTEGEFISWL